MARKKFTADEIIKYTSDGRYLLADPNRGLDIIAFLQKREKSLSDVSEWIKRHWANQDMNHEDFRVEAYRRALDATDTTGDTPR